MTLVDVDVSGHLQAVVDHLNTQGILTERGRKPDSSGWTDAPGQSPFTGYATVWRVGSIEAPGWGLNDIHDQAKPIFQVTCFGGTPTQVDDLVDDVMVAMLDGSLTVPGRNILRITEEVGISTTKDPDETPAIYYGGTRYQIWSVPV